MRISPNFTLNELTKSSTAMRLDIDNTPSMEHLVAMTALCHKIAQPIRDEFGVVTVNSCYRSRRDKVLWDHTYSSQQLELDDVRKEMKT